VIVLTAAACQKDGAKAPPSPPAPAKPAAAAAPAPLKYAPRVEVTVTDEGFVPSKIPAKAGEPLTLAITRQTDKTCATEIIFAGQEGKTDLPLGKTVEVAYTPKQSGNVKFGCAMGMMIGGILEVAP
jgi:plastocyanin domain-containing protein